MASFELGKTEVNLVLNIAPSIHPILIDIQVFGPKERANLKHNFVFANGK